MLNLSTESFLRFASIMKPIVLLFFLLILVTCQDNPNLKIAASSNMQFAVEDIILAFETKYDINADLIIGSSGKLTAQIEAGAPFDIFLSADSFYPQDMLNKGLVSGPMKRYAYGHLVLWSCQKDLNPSLSVLTHPSVKKIAIPNPDLAPYGRAAIQVLNHYKILDSVKSKLVFSESIAQCNQFITSGAADIGFTALSIVSAPKLDGIGQWFKIDPELHAPIDQVMLVLKNSKQKANAKLFYDYIYSEEGQNILKAYGYLGVRN